MADQPYREPKVRKLEWTKDQTTKITRAMDDLRMVNADLQILMASVDPTIKAYVQHALHCAHLCRNELESVLAPF